MQGNLRPIGLFLWGIACADCGGFEHDCLETRDCSGPKGFIETGGGGDWWGPSNADAGGELGVGFPLPKAVSPSNSAGSAGSAGSADSADSAGSAGSAGVAWEASGAAGSTAVSAPAVLGVTPADGATGLLSDTAIVIHFGQAMDTEATEAAYQSSELPASSLHFGWDGSASTLTLTPRAALEYAMGTPTSPARTYHYGFQGARARTGQTLQAMQFAFSTLRQVSTELVADAERTGNWTDGEVEGIHNCMRAAKAPYQATVCVGDDANNLRYTGFVSFDLSPLPATIRGFSSARLQANAVVYGAPETLGASLLEHVSFEQLGGAVLRVAPLAALGPFYSGPSLPIATHLVLDEDLTGAVQDDYLNRSARQNRSQYRLSFEKIAADGSWDDLELPTNAIRLALTYLLP
ncbi:MAG: Ig-like domain-containing protein [Pseudomonadota bacterium]